MKWETINCILCGSEKCTQNYPIHTKLVIQTGCQFSIGGLCNFPDVSCNDTSLVDCIKCHENPERLLYACYFVIIDLDAVNYLTKMDRTKVGGHLSKEFPFHWGWWLTHRVHHKKKGKKHFPIFQGQRGQAGSIFFREKAQKTNSLKQQSQSSTDEGKRLGRASYSDDNRIPELSETI